MIAPPPEALIVDDYAAANTARQRFAKKSRFPISLPNLHHTRKDQSRRRNSSASRVVEGPVFSVDAVDDQPDNVSDLSILFCRPGAQFSDEHSVNFQWAVLYENQRGLTLFSTPYYSKLSLLPTDPYPFTIPSTSSKRSKQPNYTLSEYPLPDGNWQWVSKTWMIDMQNDSGHVQHDGFEYNWCFQKHHWRAQVGNLSAGGYVRRRRWIRLMMRPAKMAKNAEVNNAGSPTLHSQKAEDILLHRISMASNLHPPSVVTNLSDLQGADMEVMDSVWLSDDEGQHWSAYCSAMKIMGRDGRKLELWRRWLGLDAHHSQATVKVAKQWSQDDAHLPSEQLRVSAAKSIQSRSSTVPPRAIEAVLKDHGVEILRSFVYPASRAQLVDMLAEAGLLEALATSDTLQQSPSLLADFWSYVP